MQAEKERNLGTFPSNAVAIEEIFEEELTETRKSVLSRLVHDGPIKVDAQCTKLSKTCPTWIVDACIERCVATDPLGFQTTQLPLKPMFRPFN
jgi:hypothetical protein